MIRALAVVALASSVFGGQMYAGGSTSMQPLPFSTTVNVQQFDPAFGQLTSVYIRAVVDVQGTLFVENTGATPLENQSFPGCGGFYYPYASMGASYCGNSLGSWQQDTCIPDLAPFDGTIDYAGASGVSVPFGPHWGYGVDNDYLGNPNPIGSQHPFILNTFTGTGTVAINAGASDVMSCQWDTLAAPPTWTMEGSVSISVTYFFNDHPATFCAPIYFELCPCGNVSQTIAGAGCANSHTDGAVLTGSGQMRVLADSFALDATNLPATTSVLFFQGTNANIEGVALGDGLRCVGGTIVRLGVKQAVAGVAHYPGPSDPLISVKGQVPAASLRYYQVWYRDADPGFCTSASSNLSSAVSSLWML